MQEKRVDWIRADLSAFFPFSWTTVTKGSVYATLYLARRPFPKPVQRGRLRDSARSTAFTGAGLPTAVVQVPTEVEILRALAELTHGLGTFPHEHVSADQAE
jgi:hypothetical protein